MVCSNTVLFVLCFDCVKSRRLVIGTGEVSDQCTASIRLPRQNCDALFAGAGGGAQGGGAIMAALFLREFIKDKARVQWAHIDAAGDQLHWVV